MNMENKSKGKKGEDTACNFLKKKKYRIIERNYRCPYGEIDIIAEHKNTLIIIEVKYRQNNKFGSGYIAVDYRKQKKIIQTTNYYINKYNIKFLVRFDVISIDNDNITHIENAFTEI